MESDIGSRTTSIAAVFQGVESGFQLESIPIPAPQGTEYLVRVLGCTICGSDLHSFQGRRHVSVPTVLGHEIVGEVVACGDDALQLDLRGNRIDIGSRITWSITTHCGNCFYCRRNLPQKCLHGMKYGHADMSGRRALTGGMAEYCLLQPGTSIIVLDPELTLAESCPINCAVATIAAAVDAIQFDAEQVVSVFGLGMLGLLTCAMASQAPVRNVVAVDPNPDRRELALRMGATHAVAPEDYESCVQSLTEGHGCDLSFECSGINNAFAQALPNLRMGGAMVLVGAVFPGPDFPLPIERLVRRQIQLIGIHNYRPEHLRQAVEFVEQHRSRFPLDALVDPWLPLSEVTKAFDLSALQGSIRVGLLPQKS